MVLVISGYDDFSYAVEMLRGGASDYLLKPVEREQLYGALEKLEAQYRKNQAAGEERVRLERQALRQLMLEGNGADGAELTARCGGFIPGEYVGVCAGECAGILPDGVLCIKGEGAAWLYAVPAEAADSLCELLPRPAGRSGPCAGLTQLPGCYRQAREGWQRSFFSGVLEYAPTGTFPRPVGVTARQLAGLVGLARGQEVVRLLRGEAQFVAQGETSPAAFARLCEELTGQLHATCQSLMEITGLPDQFADVWTFPDCKTYLDELDQWLDEFCGKAADQFSDYENKQKIRQGVQYIQQHFREPLNMAVVSNHVSMNYSLFSLLFKQYTGGNFVAYLQKLRIDEARRLLETTDRRVNEIGRSVGFSDEKHFLKVFKSAVGLSPSEYRKSAVLLKPKESAEP